jgi:hypothetical protein
VAGRGKGLLEAGIGSSFGVDRTRIRPSVMLPHDVDSESEGETMALVERLRNVVNSLRSSDPYHYECTVCGRAFQSEESNCPECGGDVERVSGAFDSTAVDPSP